MEIFMRKIGPNEWSPNSDEDAELQAKIKIGDVRSVYMGRKQTHKEHGCFFAFLRFCFNSQEHYPTLEEFITNLFLRIDYGSWTYAKVGDEEIKIFARGSTSFMRCSHEQFNKIMNDAIEYLGKCGFDFEAWKENQEGDSRGNFRYWGRNKV